MQEMISKIEALLAPLLEGTDMFVTNLQIEPGNNIKLFLPNSLEHLKIASNHSIFYDSNVPPDVDFLLCLSYIFYHLIILLVLVQ